MSQKTMLLFLLMLLSWAHMAEAGKMTFDDLYSIPRYSNPRISSDGKAVIFVLTENDLAEDERESHLWMMGCDGSNIRQLTFGPGSEWSPQWMADGGEIMFLSDRSGTTQIWSLPMSGGEARQLTDVSTSVSEFQCANNGQWILFVSRVFPECEDDGCNSDILAEREGNPVQAQMFDRPLFRHYSRWFDKRVNRLFILNLEDLKSHVVFAVPHDVPTRLLGGYRDYDFSPDGKEICFAMSTDSVPAIWPNNNLYIIPFGGENPKQITNGPGLETSPRYSPNGNYISYHAQKQAGYESDQSDLIIYDRDEGFANLTKEFDRSVGE